MTNPDDWLEEQARIVAKEEETRVKEFGYDFLMESFEDILKALSSDNLVYGGMLIGQLIQIIRNNEGYFGE